MRDVCTVYTVYIFIPGWRSRLTGPSLTAAADIQETKQFHPHFSGQNKLSQVKKKAKPNHEQGVKKYIKNPLELPFKILPVNNVL